MKPFLAFALTCLLASTVVDAGVIELRDRVSVPAGSVVRLGDVAAIHDGDDRRATSLRELPLGPAPAAGRTLPISYDEVRQKLQARGENLAAIEFRGQRQVVITAAATAPVMASKTADLATKPVDRNPPRPRVRAASDSEQRRAETLLVSVLERVFKPTETGISVDFECELAPVDAARIVNCRPEELHFVSAALRSDVATPLTVWWMDSRSVERQEAAVMVTIKPRSQRLAVRYATPKGFPVRPDDLMWVDADETTAGLQHLGDAVGKETTRSLRAGQALVPTDLASVPLMRTNDIVTVVVRRPGISVRREFKALSSGAMNDTVSLVALNDPRLRIQAVVTGYREATLGDTSSDSASASGVRVEEQAESPVPFRRSVR